MSFKTINIDEGQNIFDVAIQEYGSVEAVMMILEDNASLNGFNTYLVGGSSLLIRNNPEVPNKKLMEHFRDRIKVNSSTVQIGGIGYMQIGTTFKVS